MDTTQNTTASTTASDQHLGAALKGILDAANEDRKTWMKLGDDINRYTTGEDYAFLYQEVEGFDSNECFHARVNKASEYQQVMGSYLYQENPDAIVHSEAWASLWAKRRHAIEEQYADYSARVGHFGTHMRRVVDHALVYGRGPMWTGYNQRRRIVQDVADVAANMLLDPDARVAEEINWQARKRVKPRWEVMQLYPQSRAIIERLPAFTPEHHRPGQSRDAASDRVCYHEVWMGVPVKNYMPSLEAVAGDLTAVQPKTKYCFADGHVLHQGDWEIPFFLIDEWPGTPLDLMERPGNLYPFQPMEPGIGHLRAMNYLYTLFIVKYKLMSRTPFARMTINGQKIEIDELARILQGTHMDVLNVTVNGNENIKISDLFQRIDWGDPVPGFERIWNLISTEFERSTSLTEVLATGQTPTQIRNAATANLIETRSRTRVDSMRERVVQFMERLYRKRVFAARFLEGSDDIARLFGPEAGRLWGELGTPEAIAQEERLRSQVAAQAGATGMPPDQIEELLGPPQFVSMDAWINEADRTVDAGSARRVDAEAQQQNLNVAMNQLGPAVVNLPGGGKYVAALAKEFSKLNRFSPEMQAAADALMADIQAAQMAAMVPPVQAAPNPAAGPNAGPLGGEPMSGAA